MSERENTSGRRIGPSGQATRERLLDATYEVILERGYTAATTKNVARRAGVTEPALYVYFESKRDLVITAIRERFLPPALTAEEVNPAPGQTPRQFLVSFVQKTYKRWEYLLPALGGVLGDPDIAAALWDDPPGGGSIQGLEDLTDYLSDQQEAGVVRASLDPALLARIVVAAALYQAWLSKLLGARAPKPGIRKFAEAVVDMILRE